MKKNIYILLGAILILIINFVFWKTNIDTPDSESNKVIADNNKSELHVSERNNSFAHNSQKRNINYLGEEFTLAEFELAHPPENEDAPNWAYVLLEGYSLEAALSYSKKVLLYNKDPYAIEALPVMMTAFKELNQTGQLEYFLTTAIDSLAQEKNPDNDQRIYDLAENTLLNVSRSDAYSFSEKMALYKALQSTRMPEDIKKAALDFENGLRQECEQYSCPSSS